MYGSEVAGKLAKEYLTITTGICRKAGSLRGAGDARMDSVVVSLSKLLPGEAAGDAPWCSCPWTASTMLVSGSLASGAGRVPWISVASSQLLP
jgi:hypothetical protein